MSLIGKNLKKLRTVKKISQQALADKIGLKRATLGAYEENRSEPKIQTIIKIANEFSISIDILLQKEVTVNDLMNFNPDWTDLNAPITESFSSIPFVTKQLLGDYLKNTNDVLFLKNLPFIQIPIKNDALMGFEIDQSFSENGFYLNKGDFVFGIKIEDSKIKENKSYIVITKSGLKVSNHLLKHIIQNEILELWEVEHVFQNNIHQKPIESDIEKRLTLLEQRHNII